MFLITCNEAFGYTHEQTLDSSLSVILAMLREHGYLVNERNKAMLSEGDGAPDDTGEWTETIDFATGQKKRVRKMRL